jgi:cytochrome b561
MGSGIWFLVSQPARIRNALLGGSLLDTVLLAGAIGCALVAMGLLVPLDRISAGRLYLASASIGVTVILMVILRQRVRTLSLAPFFRTEQLSVASQWGAILFFLVLLLAGVCLVGWMVWQFSRSPDKASPQA